MATAREPWHGTASGYTQHECRCEECRAYQRKLMRAWRAEKQTPEQRARTQARQNALGRALRRLGRLHPNDLARLVREEEASEPALARPGARASASRGAGRASGGAGSNAAAIRPLGGTAAADGVPSLASVHDVSPGIPHT